MLTLFYMNNQFSRTTILIGESSMAKLANARVAIFGIGGVGGYVAEALSRSGVSSFALIDKDVVSESNINRQIIATYNTIGQSKCEVMKDRILSINPNAKVDIYNIFYLPENSDLIDFSSFDYIVDAVDTVKAKISIIKRAKELGIPIISSMGAGNKMNPTMVEVSDIYKTSVCPLAKVIRRELKKIGIKDLKVVFSKEEPIDHEQIIDPDSKKVIPGSCSFVPSVFGLVMASEIIKDLIK